MHVPIATTARLEISGIRAGTERQLKARVRQKARQTERSNGVLPAWIAVVQFSQPISYLQRKQRAMNLDQISELHERAMSLAEATVIASTQGDAAMSRTRFQEALELAAEAAALIAPHVDEEPIRSVLHRSAGSLALNCDEHRIAEKLLAVGLAGEPPSEIADEMRDLLEQVYAHRELLAS
jgi:hypothetical protein